jgi:hypothetical protein
MNLALRADQLLRGQHAGWQISRRALGEMALILVLAGFGYGAVMGTFGGMAGERLLQMIYSALKVPLLLVVTFALSLPSFFVLNTLLGLREDFRRVLSALVAAQAVLTVVLLALAPFTAFWYACSADYTHAQLFNGIMFAAASFAAQWTLRRNYQPLIARRPRHRTLQRVWLVIYIFVGIQMAWVLRPFVGSPAMPVQFFREEAWGNAYEVVVRIIWQALRG